ncbi:hypothetical protein DH2020_004906 [Rehmannia glutinosa]|uniref:Geranylgeranyl transferase type-2 subunit beta n=1 Tax=Rehmannia glutinosa TaxID=99300 RepID=A0ABR0XR54_REHGL
MSQAWLSLIITAIFLINRLSQQLPGYQWKSNICLCFYDVHHSSWFLKLNKLLDVVSRSKISLHLFHNGLSDNRQNIEDVLDTTCDGLYKPIVVVERLKLALSGPSSSYSFSPKKDDFESVVMEHLRLNGAYWGLTTLDVLGKLNAVDPDEVVSWVMECQHESGGFGGNVGHDPHMLYTLSAIQVLALFDKIDVLDVEKVANYIASLQNEDGSFSGDMWGEIDTRFSYVAICSLALLHRLDKINVERAVKYIVSCKNLDGGFGCTPGAESHAGQIFCCVGALAITGSLHHVDKDLLGWWLCERQVCYSWWVLSSLIMIDRVHWIDKKKLVNFILDCQDKENGGISDRPDDAVDVFHTYFGVAGLSLLEYPGLKAVDPAYALPVDVVNRIFLAK